MGEARDLLPDINESGPTKAEELKAQESGEANKTYSLSKLGRYQWWLQMIVYTIFVLTGQSVGTLLGRLYFNNGGNSQWLATLVQLVGFPILVPFRWLKTPNHNNHQQIVTRGQQFPLILALIYVALGIFAAADCMLYSIGLQYLPVTTYTLICTSQLGFNALFSYILNGQKFTPYIVNSLFLLSISSALLFFQPESDNSNKPSKNNKFVLGFVCTLGASAGYAFMLSVTQLAFQRIIKKESVAAIMDMAVYQSLVASIIIVVGLFGSGDWKKLHGEMKAYKMGTSSYVNNLFWTAVSWQVFMVGCVGLIFRVSSLFSNVISILGTPVAPVLAVAFLGEKMTGLKGVSTVLAMWGFASYMYQHYLDDLEDKRKKEEGCEEVSEIGLVTAERG